METREIHFDTDVTLKGTVRVPDNQGGKLPIIVLIHGSGPVDRDGNVKGMKMNAYKDLAEFFFSLGVASITYDKRGAGASEGDFYHTGMKDLVDDGIAAVKAAWQLPEIDPNKVFLLGHSEGCTLLPAINKEVDAAGLIFIAGQADNVRNASELQVKLLEEEVSSMKGFQGWLLRRLKVHKTSASKQRKLFDEIAQSNETVIRKGLAKVNAKWLREHFQYEITEDLAAIKCPILAITGSKDVQVNPQHVYLLAKNVNGEAEAHVIEGMNHLLRDQDEPVSMLKVKSIYKKSIHKPLSQELYSVLRDWTQKHITTVSS
ncbi:hypothetical protein SAMN05192533_110123 [Mesobacillus persicus]|uniref:Serine aminopeptidase S33 domain-containing protein n=1 Tax=Mesobacillus persicus TaxID=930146 RepID=A0A1H8EXG4_9BACI|nr:alpha/beta hydrolase [Mesobacillus persicus]SEN23577.1 hypothetical protein SAMN05192533_110123 [Mesobacillus persicus]